MIEHRVMTVREPYASLLVHGAKRFETRVQPTKFRGLVFILAGKFVSPELRKVGEARRGLLAAAGLAKAASTVWNEYLPGDYDWFNQLPRAAIIGAARLVDCRPCLDVIEDGELTPLEESIGYWADENFAYRMQHAVAFKTPVPCRGVLGLTGLKPEIYQAAIDELRSSTTLAQWRSLVGLGGELGLAGRMRALTAIEADVSLSE